MSRRFASCPRDLEGRRASRKQNICVTDEKAEPDVILVFVRPDCFLSTMIDPCLYWKQFENQPFNQKYWLRRFLGAGTYGGVFLADEIIANHIVGQVAIKVLHRNDQQLDQQINELRLATRLKHQYLLDCYSSEEGILGGITCLGLTMEIATGTLLDYHGNRTLPSIVVRALVQNLVAALVFLHDGDRNSLDQPIIHRDLKPANILWAGNVWKLSDMSIAHSLIRGTATFTSPSQQVGSLAYMPPEAYDGEIRPAWDIWSVGILIQELLTQTFPFSFQSPVELLKKLTFTEPEIPTSITPEFRTIIQGCLQKDPYKRWTAQQLLEALRTPAASFTSVSTSQTVEVKSTSSESDTLDLCSERLGISYYKLRDFLASGKWKKANQETAERVLEVMNRTEEGWLSVEDVKRFPSKDLQIIDRLWVDNSEGKFGFSVQKQIYMECGGQLDGQHPGDRVWNAFGNRIGWRKRGWWICYEELRFSKSAETGHLPVWPSSEDSDGPDFLTLLSRQDLPRIDAYTNNSFSETDELNLRSERLGISYYKLRDLLALGKWKKANRETMYRMLEVMSRTEEGWLRCEDMKQFPGKDLQIIDRLWVDYSGGKFGFSIQRRIYVECGGQLDAQYPGDHVWDTFGDRIGWRKEEGWIWYEDLRFSRSAETGHLPALGGGEDADGPNFLALLSRQELSQDGTL